MEDKKFSAQLGIGSPSIVMMFVIVVMCIISVLSYLDASSYYDSTYKQVNQTVDYYRGQSQGLELYYQLDSQMSIEDIEKLLKKEKVVYQIDQDVIKYQYDINDSQYVLFEISRKDLSMITMKQCNKVE